MATEKVKAGYKHKAKSSGTDILCDFNCTVSVRKSRGNSSVRSTSGSKSKSKSS